MLWRTHFLAGAAAGLLMAGHTADVKTAAITVAAAGVSALLPDLDDPHSKMGRVIPILSWAIKKVVGHRGPLHSLVGVATAYLLASLFLRAGHNHYLIPVIAVGYLSHIIIDSLNPEGCPWFWPANIHLKMPLTETGSIIERLIVSPALFVLCAYLAWPVIKITI